MKRKEVENMEYQESVHIKIFGVTIYVWDALDRLFKLALIVAAVKYLIA